ncbi:tRNA-dependent cyclodipeptide synthase [Amycolatopsis minnesotensis]|uniref:Cyclodipeptide synthase n=1 Tax=Amycolatopsis minnesotensis TaxID=337894 RepID=A0ABN2SML7_9PSEU
MFTLDPLDERYFLPGAEHVTIGLSPWNGRYKPRYIEALTTWARQAFGKVDVFVPGYQAAHTLVAAGFPVSEAVRRTRRTINKLRNPALRALTAAGEPEPEKHVLTWTQLHSRPEYQRGLARVHEAYEHNPAVRGACRSTARAAIDRMDSEPEITDERIDLAVGYALAELPLVLDGPEVYQVESTMFVYHKEMELLDPFLRPGAPVRPAPGQGYAVVTDREENDHERRRADPAAAVPVPAR